MIDSPQFSVIIPALNEEHFIGALLESLTQQTFRNFEVIVADGNSQDKTIEVVKSFSEKLPDLRVVMREHPSLPGQRNLAAASARGQYYIFIDADSVLLPYCLDRLASYLNKHNGTFLTTWFSPDQEGSNDALSSLFGNMFIEGSIIFKRQISPGPFTLVKREVFNEVHGYDEELSSWGEDYDFTQRVVRKGHELSIVRETLYIYSQRRMRHEGRLRFLQTYLKASLRILFTNKNYRVMRGYVMGGQVYTKEQAKRSFTLLTTFQHQVRKITQDLFGSGS